MTAYAPNYTARYRVHYHVAGRNHVQTWRIPGTPGPTELAAIVTVLDNYYAALIPILFDDFAFNSFTLALIDEDIFLPTSPLAFVGGSAPISGKPVGVAADAVSFVGRSLGGGPWKMYQYGLDVGFTRDSEGFDYRILTGENTDLDTAINTLGTAGGAFIANDAYTVAVYNYANYKANDRWVKKLRGTGTTFP